MASLKVTEKTKKPATKTSNDSTEQALLFKGKGERDPRKEKGIQKADGGTRNGIPHGWTGAPLPILQRHNTAHGPHPLRERVKGKTKEMLNLTKDSTLKPCGAIFTNGTVTPLIGVLIITNGRPCP
jgi:hypothetical protein